MQKTGHKLALIAELPVGKYAIPLDQVVETLRPLPVEELAGMPDWVCGIAVIRGAPVPVVNLGAIFADSPASEDSRWVTVRVGERTVALSVRRVVAIAEMASGQLESLPPLLQQGRADAIEAIGNLDRELLLTLNLARLLPDSLWPGLDHGKVSP